MYTLPFLCSIENNVTCCGNYNIADTQSNKMIRDYWKNETKSDEQENNITINKKDNKKFVKVMSIKEMKNQSALI